MEIKANELLAKLEKLDKAQGKDTINGKSFIFHSKGILSQNNDTFINIPNEDLGDFAVSSEKLLPFLRKNGKKTFELNISKKEMTLQDKNKEVIFPLEKISINIENFLPTASLKEHPVSEDFMIGLLQAARICPKKESQAQVEMLNFVCVSGDTIIAGDSLRFIRYATDTSLQGKYFLKANTLLKYGLTNITHISNNDDFVYLIAEDGTVYGIPTAFGDYIPLNTVPTVLDEVLDKGTNLELPKGIVENIDDVISIIEDKDEFKVVIKNGEINTSYKSDNVSYKAKDVMEYTGDIIEFVIDPVVFKDSILNKEVLIYGNVLCFKGENMAYITSFAKGE